MLGVRSTSTGLSLYDWETLELVRRIEVQPKHIYWSEAGALVCVATEDSYFILKVDTAMIQKGLEAGGIAEDGIEDAFEV